MTLVSSRTASAVGGMTPFQHVRFWARRAPVGQRAAVTAAIAALAVALIALVIVPSSRHDGANQIAKSGGARPVAGANTGQSPTAGAGGTDSTAGGGANGNATNGSPTGGVADSGANGGGGGCVSPPGSDQGVTDSEIKIAVILVNAGGSTTTQAFGVPAPEQQQQNYQAVIDYVNAHGGVACRKLNPVYFSPNAVDQSSLQQACLDIAQAGVFAVVDAGAYIAYAQLSKCFPEAQLPFWAAGSLAQKLQQHYYPFLFAAEGLAEVAQRNSVFALNQQGFFSAANGFSKLGIVVRSCEPEYFPEYVDTLHQIGLVDSQILSYDLGCSGASPFANPADVANAVLKFKQNGATHVTFIDDNPDFGPFTNIAETQGYRPKYGLYDGVTFATANSATSNYNSNNIDGAVGITPTRYGEQSTSGLTRSPATVVCDDLMAANGRPPSYQDQGVGGIACSSIWGLAASINHAPALQRDALAAGLETAGSFDASFPVGPNDMSVPNTTTGGQFWRTIRFSAACRCWQVVGDPAFQPSFP